MSETTRGWPPRMRYRMTCDYLWQVHGIRVTPKTLANRVCEGTGPEVKYFDTIPHCTPVAADAWVEGHLRQMPRTKRGALRRASDDVTTEVNDREAA